MQLSCNNETNNSQKIAGTHLVYSYLLNLPSNPWVNLAFLHLGDFADKPICFGRKQFHENVLQMGNLASNSSNELDQMAESKANSKQANTATTEMLPCVMVLVNFRSNEFEAWSKFLKNFSNLLKWRSLKILTYYIIYSRD